MALTPSAMLPLGTKAPAFNLRNVIDSQLYSLDLLKSDQATVIMFICNHCPFVKHIIEKLTGLAAHYQTRGIRFIAISSNDVEAYPEDAPDHMKLFAKMHNFSFPYLYDESQDTAKAYQAACTPDFYVFDKNLLLVYRGRFDDASPGKDVPVSGTDLQSALDAILNNNTIDQDQRPSMGCNIKWKEPHA